MHVCKGDEVHGFTHRSGNMYKGEWLGNRRHGQGIMYWNKQREQYSGEWTNGVQVQLDVPIGGVVHLWYLGYARGGIQVLHACGIESYRVYGVFRHMGVLSVQAYGCMGVQGYGCMGVQGYGCMGVQVYGCMGCSGIWVY